MANVAVGEEKWSAAQEQLIQGWAECARIRSVMHNRTAGLYETGNYIVGPLSLIFTSVSALTQFSIFGDQCESNAAIIAAVILTVLGSVMSGLQTFFRFDRTSGQHRTVANRYDAVHRDMQEMLAYNPDQRENAVKFITRIKKELNALMSANNLSIPQHVADRYVKDVDAVLGSSPGSLPLAIATPVPTKDIPVVQVAIPVHPDADDGDYQDEFAEVIRQRMADRQEQIEAYQMNRMLAATSLPSPVPPPPLHLSASATGTTSMSTSADAALAVPLSARSM